MTLKAPVCRRGCAYPLFLYDKSVRLTVLLDFVHRLAPSSVPVIQAVTTIIKRGVIGVKNNTGGSLGFISKNSLSKVRLRVGYRQRHHCYFPHQRILNLSFTSPDHHGGSLFRLSYCQRMFEQELHHPRRGRTHGQEDDLKLALDMLINRVAEMVRSLSHTSRTAHDHRTEYATQRCIQVSSLQLNVAKFNLQLVISNEMLEDALKRESSTQPPDVGWRRTTGREDNRSVLERY